MGKIIAWLIVVFIVMLALRIANLRNARARAKRSAEAAGTAGTGPRTVSEPMVRCVRCGVFLPRGEAKTVKGGYACTVGECASHA
ncbi:MAG TPA: PP0621 family protein [Casimicrobiaceae bacterium]|nr:PP0621 family protein [Casimicrobiaceae bacterium]